MTNTDIANALPHAITTTITVAHDATNRDAIANARYAIFTALCAIDDGPISFDYAIANLNDAIRIVLANGGVQSEIHFLDA